MTSNCTNSTQATGQREPLESTTFITTKIVFYFLILLCTTVGNSMVVYVICTSRKMRSSSNLLVLNLAVCDLFTPLISIPFDFALEENHYVYLFGKAMCKVLGPSATLTTTAASLTLAAISLDRYRIIMHPFKTRLSSKQIKLIILGIYVFSVIAVFPYAYVLRLENSDCSEHWPMVLYRQLYTMALFLIQYALPLVFMIIMYAFAIKNLYSASDKMRNNSIHTPAFDMNKLEDSEGKRVFFRKLRRKSVGEENPNARATKMFMTVVAVFSVFMFPNQVLWLWADYGDGLKQPHFRRVSVICWLFTYTNGVVNPIIFAIFSKEFRSGFKALLKFIFCCNQEVISLGKGRFEFFTRTATDSSSHSYDGATERGKHFKATSINTGYDTINSLRKSNCDFFPPRPCETTLFIKTLPNLTAQKHGSSCDKNSLCDKTLESHSYREPNRGESRLSGSFSDRSMADESTARCTDGVLKATTPLNSTDMDSQEGFLDKSAFLTFTDLPETYC